MNGYEYLVARDRLMQRLEEELRKLAPLPVAEREAETRRIQAKFDVHSPRCTQRLPTNIRASARKRRARSQTLGKLGASFFGSLNQYPGRAHSQPG